MSYTLKPAKLLVWNERCSSWSKQLVVEIMDAQKLQNVFVACELLWHAVSVLLYLRWSHMPMSAADWLLFDEDRPLSRLLIEKSVSTGSHLNLSLVCWLRSQPLLLIDSCLLKVDLSLLCWFRSQSSLLTDSHLLETSLFLTCWLRSQSTLLIDLIYWRQASLLLQTQKPIFAADWPSLTEWHQAVAHASLYIYLCWCLSNYASLCS